MVAVNQYSGGGTLVQLGLASTTVLPATQTPASMSKSISASEGE